MINRTFLVYWNILANEQHYEVPDEFYYAVLGPYLKYSSGFWKDENTTLAESEIYMLDMYIERAGVDDVDNLDESFLLLVSLSLSVTIKSYLTQILLMPSSFSRCTARECQIIRSTITLQASWTACRS